MFQKTKSKNTIQGYNNFVSQKSTKIKEVQELSGNRHISHLMSRWNALMSER